MKARRPFRTRMKNGLRFLWEQIPLFMWDNWIFGACSSCLVSSRRRSRGRWNRSPQERPILA